MEGLFQAFLNNQKILFWCGKFVSHSWMAPIKHNSLNWADAFWVYHRCQGIKTVICGPAHKNCLKSPPIFSSVLWALIAPIQQIKSVGSLVLLTLLAEGPSKFLKIRFSTIENLFSLRLKSIQEYCSTLTVKPLKPTKTRHTHIYSLFHGKWAPICAGRKQKEHNLFATKFKYRLLAAGTC